MQGASDERGTDRVTYQMFDELSETEYARLKEDIRRRGILIPIEVDENGEILDGHHRGRIADELGIEAPTVVRSGWSEDEKRRHIYAVNTFRRHVSKPKRLPWINEYAQLTIAVGDEPLPEWFVDNGKVTALRTPSASPKHATERQRFHRLRERIRPMEPPAPDSDPWEIANDALLLLSAVRLSISSPAALAKLEQAEELLRQLAWGPEE